MAIISEASSNIYGIYQCWYVHFAIVHESNENLISIFFTAVVIALGLLTMWHGKLVYRGESSIEAHINASETKRLAEQKKQFQNPYDFGPKKNFQLFLGLTHGRYVMDVYIP